MFLIDDLLLAPFRGLTFIASSVHDAAQSHVENERTALRDELNDLYMQLDTGMIDEATFDEREDEILERLDALDDLDDTLTS